MEQPERQDLINLLESIRRLLEHLISNGYVSAALQPDFAEVARLLAGQVGSVTAELESAQHDSALEGNGLSGAQMRLKKRGFRRALWRFIRLPSRRTAIRVLGWANVFLGSLASAIGMAEPIKELKEAIEAAIKDTDDELPPGGTPPTPPPPAPTPALSYLDAFSEPPEV